MKVRLTKTNITDSPRYQTAGNLDEYSYSAIDVSPPIDYQIEGILWYKPVVGSSVRIDKSCGRTTTTSRVTKITDDGFETQNSVYKLEYIDT